MSFAQPILRQGSAGGGRQLGLGDVELVLEPEKEFREVRSRGGELGRRPAQVGTELVEGTERGEARSVLRYAGAAQETGFAAVAAAGV
jgi:hypothetical protein